MQFMIIRKADAATEALLPPAPGLIEDMERFHRQLADEGKLGLAMGLCPSAHAVRLKVAPGGESITDGPFAETKELVAGFTIIEADSKEAAIARLRQWPPSDADATGEVTLELRESGCPGGCAQVASSMAGNDDSAGRYVILLRSSAESERDTVPAQEKLDALDVFNAAELAAGVLLAGDGLMSSARGARVTLAGSGGHVVTSVIDGPFAEAKELIAGFWMIRAKSLDEAIAWARRVPYPTGPHVEVEIREVLTISATTLELVGA
jgi:hypothetical protein